MALSLLGIWEIPIPGFIGSGSVQQAAAKEGITGAFLKGVVTTILAIPCTGPFMATALGWALDKPAVTTFQVFAVMGFGMASPYILVGVYPQLLRFLPKPGAWMETFKQAMGFVLLATVVFILSYMESPAVVPTLALLAGIALACWIYSRTPITAEFNDRVHTWGLCAAITAASALFAFGYLYPQVMVPRFEQRVGMLAAKTADSRVQSLVAEFSNSNDATDVREAIRRFEAKVAADAQGDWQPFSLRKLGQLAIEEGRTVLVDFSAEWCVTCKTLEQTVLHTEPVDQAIRAGNVVTLYADFTDFAPEIQETIKSLRSSGVPVIAVFPGNDPYRPIVFRGAYTQSGIIEALEKATGRKLDAEAVAMNAGTL
jgi:thiol:disulfide interchange protein DsbD